MNGRRLATLVVLIGGFAATTGIQPGTAAGQQAQTYARTPAELVPFHNGLVPHRFFYRTPPQYRGEGRSLPPPGPVESVRVGLMVPMDPQAHDGAGIAIGRGVRLALEEENANGGYRGIPFEIVARDDRLLWGSSANTLVELAWGQHVWVVIGSVDGDSSHVALRAAFKAEVPIVNVGATDPTLTETGIPWIVRTTPDDRQTGYALARLLFEQEARRRVAVLRASDRYGRAGVREFRDAARRLGRPLPMEILFAPGTKDFGVPLHRIARADVDAVVLWAEASDAARIVRQMRDLGMRQRVVGTDRMASARFLVAAGEAAEGATMTAWPFRAANDPQRVAFERRFERRFEAEPDAFAAYGYDTGHLVARAIRAAGLNRARIRDELARTRAYEGVAGTMVFDATSNNVAPLRLLTVHDGKLVATSEAAASQPAAAMPLRLGVVLEPGASSEDLLAGARRAAAEANAQGGADGHRVQIVPVRPRGAWIDAGSAVARAAVEAHLHALVGAVSGAAAHIVAQIATRLRIPAIVLSPEASLTAAGDPWVFRRIPSDIAQARVPLQLAMASGAQGRVAAVVPGGREGRQRLEAIRSAARSVGATVVAVTGPDQPLPGGIDIVALWLDAPAAVEFVGRNRSSMPEYTLGSSRLMTPAFLDVTAGLPSVLLATMGSGSSAQSPAGPRPSLQVGFASRLAHAAVQDLVDAAAKGGLRPGRIRDALASSTIAGKRVYDARGGITEGVRVLVLGRRLGLARPGGM